MQDYIIIGLIIIVAFKVLKKSFNLILKLGLISFMVIVYLNVVDSSMISQLLNKVL